MTLVLLLEKGPTLPTPVSGWDPSSHDPVWNEWSCGHTIRTSTAKLVQLALVRPLTAQGNQGRDIPGSFLGTPGHPQSCS